VSQETDLIQVFAKSDSLNSSERKAYYKELVAFSREWLLGMPIDAAQHFKRLFFEGYLPANRGALGVSEPFLICLSAPTLDKDYVISVFNQYANHSAYDVVKMWDVHFDGRNRAVSPDRWVMTRPPGFTVNGLLGLLCTLVFMPFYLEPCAAAEAPQSISDPA
jgi:hypothetical protein